MFDSEREGISYILSTRIIAFALGAVILLTHQYVGNRVSVRIAGLTAICIGCIWVYRRWLHVDDSFFGFDIEGTPAVVLGVLLCVAGVVMCLFPLKVACVLTLESQAVCTAQAQNQTPSPP